MSKERTLTREQRAAAFVKWCQQEFHRTRGEEWANGITHLIGVVFGVVALTMMVIFASLCGNVWHIVSCSVYGATLILLTLSSTLYHLLTNFRAKRVFQIFDHCSIYLLIAGTYTPITLVSLEHTIMGWSVFGIEWGLAVLGVLLETLLPKAAKYASLPIYLVMGWLILVDMRTAYAHLTAGGMALLAAGGLTYSLGVIFFLMDHTPYMHTIWHLFVLGGIACHWVCITFYVIPALK